MHEIKQFAYSIDNNKWLQDVVAELPPCEIVDYDAIYEFVCASRIPENTDTQTQLIKTATANFIKENRKQTESANIFILRVRAARGDFDTDESPKEYTISDQSEFIKYRFINKYRGADNATAVRAMEKIKLKTKLSLNDIFQRRQNTNKRKYREKQYLIARQMRKKYVAHTK